jgi:hypothetical protein
VTDIMERPFLIAVAGAAVAAVLFFFWLQIRRKELLWFMLIVFLATLSMLLVERTVQTDREEIGATLHQIASLVENNDFAAALDFVHSASEGAHDRAEAELNSLRFERAQIKQNLEIDVAEGTSPPTATATFNAVVVLSEGGGGRYVGRPIPVYLEVKLLKEAGRWQVVDFTADVATRGFQKKSGT